LSSIGQHNDFHWSLKRIECDKMQQRDKESSTRKIGRGLSPVALGRYTADFYRTTEQIAYHCDIRDSCTKPDDIAREQRIIDSCTEHLEELKEKIR